MNPPSENPQFIKIDESNFYYATTSSTQYNVDDIKTDILNHQNQIVILTDLLNSAVGVGVSEASVKVDEVAITNNAVIKL